MMTNLEIIENLYNAFAIGDVPNVLANMNKDIIWNEAENFPYSDNNPYIGPRSVLEGVLARCMSEWEGFAANMTTLYDAGDNIIATGRYAGKTILTGKEMSPQAVHIWSLNNGEIVKFQQYIDTLNVNNALN
ncbi:MAG: ketosteroid isomerase-like protein [Pseudohongiellaceae bacterium]|jgi:ketosteroid isomerase-like protein